MDKMIKSSSDQASEVALEVQQLIARMMKVGKGVKGRQMIFMVLETVRTHDRLDLVFGVEHLYKLSYPEDKKMGDFKQRWLEIIAGIKPESVSQEEELRDTQLKGDSKELELELKLYERMERGDPAKTHKYLLNMLDRRVKASKEERN